MPAEAEAAAPEVEAMEDPVVAIEEPVEAPTAVAEESGSGITVIIWGVFSGTQMPLDVFSPFAPPT